jgi:phosphoribosylglycinamide formyltransferase 1
MSALIAAARAPDFPAEIALVVSDRPDASGLALAKEAGVAASAIDHKIYAGRDAFEASLQTLLEIHRIELICLAGFMRVLSAPFAGRWRGRLINIHPSLLPAFRGLDTHRRALQSGAKVHGCTVHFVEPKLDAGPIIAQSEVPILEGDTPETLAARVLQSEHQLYPAALAQVATDEVNIDTAEAQSQTN